MAKLSGSSKSYQKGDSGSGRMKDAHPDIGPNSNILQPRGENKKLPPSHGTQSMDCDCPSSGK